MCAVRTFGGCRNGIFQNTHNKTKPRTKISIDGLNVWNKIEGKVEIGNGSFGVACKATFNGNKVVVNSLPRERVAEIALFAKEGRLLNTFHHENIVEIKRCCFSPCALMLGVSTSFRSELRRKLIVSGFNFWILWRMLH